MARAPATPDFPEFLSYAQAMDELFVHLKAQKLPKVIHALLGDVLDNPVKLFCVVGDPGPAVGASQVAPGSYASNSLKKLIEAVRALDWELVRIILEHAASPTSLASRPIVVSPSMIDAGTRVLRASGLLFHESQVDSLVVRDLLETSLSVYASEPKNSKWHIESQRTRTQWK